MQYFNQESKVYGRDLYACEGAVNEQLARYGVKFGIYKNNTFKEQLFPFDSIPRVIAHDELSQRKNFRSWKRASSSVWMR